MADITDPTFTTFINEKFRIIADNIVGMKDALDTTKIQWVDTMSPIVSGNAGTDPILDGSEADGRTPLTKADADVIAGAMNSLLAALTPAVMSAMVKAHVNVRNPLA